MTFVRNLGGELSHSKIMFDSSPKYSICKQFGYKEESYRQECILDTEKEKVYNVFATQQGSEMEHFAGILTWKRPAYLD